MYYGSAAALPYYDILVDANDSGDFKTIEAAIESLPMYNYERVIIVIKNGIYNEKIKIDRDYVTLLGESKDSTIIEFDQLRSNWDKHPDHLGPAVINIFADDVVLNNLTIKNTQPETGPHAFAIYGTGTRTILLNCNALSKGGDTVSLWDYKTGMYYHAYCHFEGAVDFVCPRGWCFITHSTFYEVEKTAAIWHAAPTNAKQKFVLQDCQFDGVQDFYLARHHYDACFYLMNCAFSPTMADKKIVHVYNTDKPESNRPYLNGNRYYFDQCSRDAGNYDWFQSNIDQWPVLPEKVTAQWTFDNEWNPEDSTPIIPVCVELSDSNLLVTFSELIGVRGQLTIQSTTGKVYRFYQGRGRDKLEFRPVDTVALKDEKFVVTHGVIYAITAGCTERNLTQFAIENN